MRQNQASIPGGREGIEDAYTVAGRQTCSQNLFPNDRSRCGDVAWPNCPCQFPRGGGRPVLFCPEKALFPLYNSPTNLVCSKNISSPSTDPHRKEEAPPPPSANPMKVCGGITTTKKRDFFLSFSSSSATKTKTRPTSSSRFQTRENNVLIPPTQEKEEEEGPRRAANPPPTCLPPTNTFGLFPSFLSSPSPSFHPLSLLQLSSPAASSSSSFLFSREREEAEKRPWRWLSSSPSLSRKAAKVRGGGRGERRKKPSISIFPPPPPSDRSHTPRGERRRRGSPLLAPPSSCGRREGPTHHCTAHILRRVSWNWGKKRQGEKRSPPPSKPKDLCGGGPSSLRLSPAAQRRL